MEIRDHLLKSMSCRFTRALAMIISTGILFVAACSGGSGGTPSAQAFKVLAWNNLGMHCYNPSFKAIGVLPPYNTLWAQVVKAGDPPEIVTQGITVEYSFDDNTYSAGSSSLPDKTDFWTYVKQLFGVDLAVNVGLAGNGLAGQMKLDGDHFVAEGIPLTEYGDAQAKQNPDPSTWTRDPYQLATIIVKDAATGQELTRATVVAPVSSELNCNNCHTDDGDATTRYPITPTGSVDTNILTLHDFLNPGAYSPSLMASQPVLCASCHSSNALNAPGKSGIESLSNAMHKHHAALDDITPDTAGCYKCHPGPVTQCLRDVMSQRQGFNCPDCHGTMANVAQNANPWLSEPRCDSAQCHGAEFALDKALYRESRGHGGIYCAGCHDSPHAIAPSREARDGIKFTELQGQAGPLSSCSVCHTTARSGDVHGGEGGD